MLIQFELIGILVPRARPGYKRSTVPALDSRDFIDLLVVYAFRDGR